MRSSFFAFLLMALPLAAADVDPRPAQLERIFAESLGNGDAYRTLEELTRRFPGRLSGSPAHAGAVDWLETKLQAAGFDRVRRQETRVIYWERGAPESVTLLGAGPGPIPLAATALGFSGATPVEGLTAEVVVVNSLEELRALGPEAVRGKIVFFHRPMDPALFHPGRAYGRAGDQRNRGPALAASLGAVGAVVRSLTHAHDDVPHTGYTGFPPETPAIPAAALSSLAAERLLAAVRHNPSVRLEMKVFARTHAEPVISHNLIAELTGSEFPDQILLVGGHSDSWDIAPGAHDDGAGVVQAIEVLRLFKTLGIRPRHTLRCVLFTNEENGLAGGLAYAKEAEETGEKHIFAIESDAGGFQPRGFELGHLSQKPATRAEKWIPLFAPYGLGQFFEGTGGADVNPLMAQGVTVGDLRTDSQRYFDIHHTREDDIDQVNPRELQIGAAALASLLWLIDQEGL